MKIPKLVPIIILAMLLTACAGVNQAIILEPTVAPTTVPPTAGAPTAVPAVEAPALADILGNLSYSGIFPDQAITLKDGTYEYSEGGPGKPYVRLADTLIRTGDINADGVEDAVFLLEDNSEGSADFTLLGAVLNVWDDPQPLEVVQVEDRIAMKSLALDGSRVIAEYIGHGSGDVDCCPTWNVRQVFEFKDDRMNQISREEISKASAADLYGTSWRLVDLNSGQEPVLPDTEITLNIEDGQISGFAGCNHYNGSVIVDQEFPNELKVSPITTTQKACPEPTSSQEAAYLTRLGDVEKWFYDFGYLALVYPLEDGTFGEMTFIPANKEETMTEQIVPGVVTDLIAAYGAPSQAAFGSAVFYESLSGTKLEQAALAKYRYFVGELWERYGEEAWMTSWKEVYRREAGAKGDIVSELRGIQNQEAALSVPMILENIEGAEKARLALSSVFDDPTVTDLRVYTLGDGGAMAGILVAGAKETGEAVFLVFLLD
jgi:heat shock protein HslJ